MTDRLEVAARAAMDHAYARYSEYRVGAAIETADGSVFAGCNVENAAYSVTCCAERVALFSAVAAGQREPKRLVVVASGQTPYPCGPCRQALSEFATGPLPITIVDGAGERRETSLEALLPEPFVIDRGRPA